MSDLDSKTILCSMKHRGRHPVGINQDKMITGVSVGNLNRYYAEPFSPIFVLNGTAVISSVILLGVAATCLIICRLVFHKKNG